jgi:uncharacterized membrane protein YozB (DUF420 family)
MIDALPTVNACLNAAATLLLLAGWLQIRRGRLAVGGLTPRHIALHRNLMLAAFAVSVVFLACYVTYHLEAGSKQYLGPARPVYLAILLSHIVLAAAVPVLACWTIYLGLKDRPQKHIRLARWTCPIWLYVSVTGVIIYLMLYHLPAGG